MFRRAKLNIMSSKYKNRKVTAEDGTVFDSRKEYKRYEALLEEQSEGIISDLRRQVKFELIPPIYQTFEKRLKTKIKQERRCVQKATHYIADFSYVRDGKVIVEDVKASFKFQDPVYRLKKRLMRYVHGIEIHEVY